jgi:diacylglycerol kinase family enzyme
VFFLKDLQLHAIKSNGLSESFDGYALNSTVDDYEGHIIVSVLSGKCLAEGFQDDVIAPLLEHFNLSAHYKVHKTTSATTVTELAKTTLLPVAIEGKKQHVVLLSGDGGIVDIINELLSVDSLPETYLPPLVSLIPMGTGNALAHSTKVFDGTNGLASWLRGNPKDLPLFRTEFSHAKEGAKLLSDQGRGKEDLTKRSDSASYLWGAVVFSWGFHAQIVADSDTAEFRKHGIDRFKMAAQEALFPSDGSGPHNYRGGLTIEKRNEQGAMTWERLGDGEHSYVLGTLVSNLEEQFTISPHSTPFNGRIRLVHINHKDGNEIIRIMGLAYQQGKHIEDKEVDYEDVDGFALSFEEDNEKWRRVCVDGKIVLVEQGGSVEVRREKQVALQLTSLV